MAGAHLTVGGETWCAWTCCKAGSDIAEASGVHTCSAPSLAEAKRRAAKLAPHFRPGAVKAVAGPCPNAPEV